MSEKDVSPLIDHLLELRHRLLYVLGSFFIAFIISYHFSDEIFTLLVKPLASIFEGKTGRRLIYTGLAEAFVTYLKVALFTATFVTLPHFAIQVWLFISPGLFPTEKKVILPFLLLTPIFFGIGAAFAYYVIIPPAWKFFLAFEETKASQILPIQLEARVSEYLSIIMQLILAFGTSFLLPVLLTLLGKIGVISSRSLATKRKYAFLSILIVAAIVTPPDVLSMIGLALPLYFLYETSIFCVYFFEKRGLHVGH
ncbi:MAG: twin arginine-targeting protein translocase TatC [Caedibacter sp. 37-49]|nr:MAG: twin arginine-targeting protein translocase TatC [Caedibacter sp. 37-49]